MIFPEALPSLLMRRERHTFQLVQEDFADWDRTPCAGRYFAWLKAVVTDRRAALTTFLLRHALLVLAQHIAWDILPGIRGVGLPSFTLRRDRRELSSRLFPVRNTGSGLGSLIQILYGIHAARPNSPEISVCGNPRCKIGGEKGPRGTTARKAEVRHILAVLVLVEVLMHLREDKPQGSEGA